MTISTTGEARTASLNEGIDRDELPHSSNLKLGFISFTAAQSLDAVGAGVGALDVGAGVGAGDGGGQSQDPHLKPFTFLQVILPLIMQQFSTTHRPSSGSKGQGV
mmetsp:Transcript_3857/g.7389  ORF Transcript_3857/g.7389 Transcript_3857/m.7389 type:complete len:105 (-) Transcript_3857:259-573(-)